MEDRIVIDPEGADLVRTIFQMYADGSSLKQICANLDGLGIHPPGAAMKRKKTSIGWNPSTLSGNLERGEGILNNRLYIGERIFNRRRYVEEPDGKGGIKRRPRDNDPSLWKITMMPELRIISDDLWSRVKDRQALERTRRDHNFGLNKNPLAGAKRQTYLFRSWSCVAAAALSMSLLAEAAGVVGSTFERVPASTSARSPRLSLNGGS
ncbi:recombinase family protein [Sphingomonas sp. BN140010]|uniref:Recombinase family protein n=1 Tax=Sphingomonas arvum TaxID=2992113 RepID=A0ABT3JEX4_9SPHN|nr:recombinase family protein [Sphingomonas sp. BN140010]MCW3797627.1 recombinase family protein [Sphingomonas sp. BN140010]